MSCRVTYSGDITMKEILSRVGDEIEAVIKDLNCPVHDIESTIEPVFNDEGKVLLLYQCCCDDFENMLSQKIDSLIF